MSQGDKKPNEDYDDYERKRDWRRADQDYGTLRSYYQQLIDTICKDPKEPPDGVEVARDEKTGTVTWEICGVKIRLKAVYEPFQEPPHADLVFSVVFDDTTAKGIAQQHLHTLRLQTDACVYAEFSDGSKEFDVVCVKQWLQWTFRRIVPEAVQVARRWAERKCLDG